MVFKKKASVKADTKGTKKVEEVVIEEVKETPEVTKKLEAKPKTIKKGSKITISGRCFGSSNLECPMGTVKNYSTKILDIENGNYLIDKGWISSKGLKD